MAIPPNITRRALLALTGPLALLPLAGCDTTAEAGSQDAPGTQQGSEQQGSAATQGDTTVAAPPADRLLFPSDHSLINEDAAWCAPFQICWDMLIEDFNCGEPIPEDGRPQTVTDLNNGSFEAAFLDEDHYVTYVGQATTQAKAEIERLIDERFDQKSDILDELIWEDNPETLLYVLYCMLYREFTYGVTFDVLDNAPFGSEAGGNLVENVGYFGFDKIVDMQDQNLRNQVEPLYWEADDRCAVQIRCKEGDVLILARGLEGSTIDELWEDVTARKDANTAYIEAQSFACPKLNVDFKTSYEELVGVNFTNPDNKYVEIMKALQTLQFKLDETGGTIKSEAAIEILYGGGAEPELCDFRFDDSFTLFLVNPMGGALKYPYAVLNITDIEKFL